MNAAARIIDAEGRGRFEATTDGALTGYLDYRRGEEVVEYVHTFVSQQARGRGIGGELVQGALEDARHRGLKVRATCPFVAGWLAHHAGYRDLVASG